MNEMTPEEGHGLKETAQRVHETIDKKGSELMDFAHRTTDRLESAAGYLSSCDRQQIWKDATDFCRRYPTQTMVAALIVGILTGRALSRTV